MIYKSCILITGTSRGLGIELAREYLNTGELVVGCSRDGSEITHANYNHYRVDISDESTVHRMFDDLRKKKLVPYLLINNAALANYRILSLTNSITAKKIIDTNLLGTFLICKEVARIMQRYKYGRIINLSSVHVSLASQGCALYNATKAGIDAMGQSLANELKAYDITVNTIGISLVHNTGMANQLNANAISTLQSRLVKPLSLTISEVLAAINFFASKEAKNITGQTINFGGVK